VDSAVAVGAFVALLAVAVVVSNAAERLRVPSAVLLVAAGVAARSIWHLRPPFDFAPALFFVFLPPLVFEGAWSIDLRALLERLPQVTMLAIPGTILTALSVAFALSWLGALPFGAAFVLGAIVAATDPVAVIAAFRSAAVPSGIRTLVEAESLSNDGIAIVLYGAALVLATGGSVSWGVEFVRADAAVLGGIALGAALAVPAWFALRASTAPEYELTMTVALAYGAYLLGDRFHLSGIFATAAAAVALRALLWRREALANRDDIDVFWGAAAYITNAVVFLATGLLIDLGRILSEPLLVVGLLAVLAVSRIGLVALFVPENRDRAIVFLAGMRGALPLALALALPQNVPHRAEIIDGVFATVLVSLIAFGIPLGGVARRLFGRHEEAPAAGPNQRVLT
jgi:CPA1 family monovalent cation:H+ antiporter